MDIEGTIQFIIGQQGQFVADIHLLQQSQSTIAAQVERLADKVDKLADVVKNHDDGFYVQSATINRLEDHLEDYIERQGWLFEGHKQLTEKLDRLADSQQRTDATVGKLVAAVEDFIRRYGHNGHEPA